MRHRATPMSHSDLYMRYNNGRRGVAASYAHPPSPSTPFTLEPLTPAATAAVAPM